MPVFMPLLGSLTKNFQTESAFLLWKAAVTSKAAFYIRISGKKISWHCFIMTF